jgi:hypothetical protein
MITQIGNFQKFKFGFLAAISSSTLCAVFRRFANYQGKTWFNIPRGQTPLPNPASILSLLKPAVPLHQLSCHGSGHGDTSPQPLSLNAPSTAPESPLSLAWSLPLCSAAAARPHYLALNPQWPAPSRNFLPVHRPLPLSLAFKRSPRPCKRTRTTTLYLPDIIPQSLSLSVAQELDARAPRARRSAAVPDHLPRRRLPETAETNHRRRPAPSPPLPATAGEPP